MSFLNHLSADTKLIIAVSTIIVSAIVLTRVIRWLIDKSFLTASERLNLDKTRYRFFKNAVSLIIWLIAIGAIISLVPKLKALAYTLFAGAGILVAIIGFAAQQAFSNIVSGIFIVMFKPFRVGDKIKVGSYDYGVVEDITLRHTVINSFENKRIIVPNSVMGSETIINDNINDAKLCKFIEVGISYDSDMDLAMKIMKEIAESHPYCIDNRSEEELTKGIDKVVVRMVSFGDFSINLRAFVWTNDPFVVYEMTSDINRQIKKRFDEEGIEIPFPYRTIVYKNDLNKTASNESKKQ
ncbi:MAG: mechanosensitive ion channel [Flavobacteriales bacterium]|nr:mechanosensitive ion channel [Flavobacteriales bacterium]